jgi:CBS domain-containing protein
MQIKDLMSEKLVTVSIPSDRRAALRQMVQHGISGLPVLDKEGNLAGIITRKDIFRKVEEERLMLLMTPDPITIAPDDSPTHAAELMIENGIRRLPVVEDDALIGIITPTDLLAIIENYGTGTVGDYVGGACVPVYQDTPLPVLASIIHASQIYALPVLDPEGHLVGIVTDGDMFKEGTVDETIVKSDLGIGVDEDSWTWEGLRNVMKLYYIRSKISLPSIPVKDIMVKETHNIFKESPIKKAAKILRMHGIGQTPVIDGRGELDGMLFNKDLLKWFLRESEGDEDDL